MFLDYVQVALDRSRLRRIFNVYVKVKHKIRRDGELDWVIYFS